MTLKAKIKKLLELKPQLRNSDKELLLEIFRLKGKETEYRSGYSNQEKFNYQ